MLKKIPPILSPELMKVLIQMGHGDEIVIADGNFPSASHNAQVIDCSGHGALELLEAILEFFPLDTYSDDQAVLMQVVAGDEANQPEIWEDYHQSLQASPEYAGELTHIDRFDFYDRTKEAFAVIQTSETALYANLLLKKGVVN